MFYSSSSDIGNPPQHLPIIDGGNGKPEQIIIGPEMTPPKENPDVNSVQSSL